MSITSPDRNTSSSRRVSPDSNGGGRVHSSNSSRNGNGNSNISNNNNGSKAKKKRRRGGKPKKKRHTKGIKTGRWTDEESTAFLLGMKKHGPGRWSLIGLNIPTRDTMQVKTHGQTILKRMRKGENVYKLVEGLDIMDCDYMSSENYEYNNIESTANTNKQVMMEAEPASALPSNNNRSIPTESSPLPMNRIDQNSGTNNNYLYGSAHPYDSARPSSTNKDSMNGTRNDEHPATTHHNLNAHTSNGHNDEYVTGSSQHQHDSYEHAYTATHSQHHGYTRGISPPIDNATLHQHPHHQQQGVEQMSHSQSRDIASGSDSGIPVTTNAVDDAIIHMGHDVDFLEPAEFDFQNNSNGHHRTNNGIDSSDDYALNQDDDPLVDPIEFDSPDASINLVEYNEWADDLANISIHFPSSDADFEAATAAHADSANALFHDAIFHQRVSP